MCLPICSLFLSFPFLCLVTIRIEFRLCLRFFHSNFCRLAKEWLEIRQTPSPWHEKIVDNAKPIMFHFPHEEFGFGVVSSFPMEESICIDYMPCPMQGPFECDSVVSVQTLELLTMTMHTHQNWMAVTVDGRTKSTIFTVNPNGHGRERVRASSRVTMEF